MVILDIAACEYAGITLCKAAYIVEGDRHLILVAEEALYKLEKLIVNGFGTQNIERVVDEAFLLIFEANTLFEGISTEATAKFSSAEEEL